MFIKLSFDINITNKRVCPLMLKIKIINLFNYQTERYRHD